MGVTLSERRRVEGLGGGALNYTLDAKKGNLINMSLLKRRYQNLNDEFTRQLEESRQERNGEDLRVRSATRQFKNASRIGPAYASRWE